MVRLVKIKYFEKLAIYWHSEKRKYKSDRITRLARWLVFFKAINP